MSAINTQINTVFLFLIAEIGLLSL